MTMDITEAIRRAEQWRKDGACGPAAVVAIALLNELEHARINVAAYRNFTADMIVEAAASRPAQHAHKWDACGERCLKCGDKDWMGGGCSVPDTLAQAQSKANDDMLAAQRNLLLREDGYPNAPVRAGFYPTAVTLSVSDGFGPHPGTTST